MHRTSRLRLLLLSTAACPLVTPLAVDAQRPTSDQARVLLQTRPDLVAQLRQRLATSGLTPDQVRARLRAEGYPENLLDPYLVGGAVTASDSLPSHDVLSAVNALGVTSDSAGAPFVLNAGDTVSGAVSAGDRARSREFVVYDTAAYLRTLPDTLLVDSTRRDAAGRPVVTIDRAAVQRHRAPPPPDSGYTIFGLDVFRRRTSQFEPNLSGPVDPSYRLGPGDRIVLILTGDVESAHTLEVTREGFVVIPQVGQLYVANLTLAQVEDLLYARLGRVYSGVRRGPGATTRFSLSVARLRSNQVFIVGDVVAPGSYRVSSAGTALTALYAAGGPTLNGSLRNIKVRRAGRVVDSLDVYDYFLKADNTHDTRLESGDVLFVGTRESRVRVVGEVLRPATYELRTGETLADAIRDAGGFTSAAARRRVQIERIVLPSARTTEGRDRIVLDIASSQLAIDYGPAFPLQPGDVVRVFRVAERVRDRIFVRGNVWSPGPQGFTPGMKLSDAIRLAGGVKPDVYLGRVLISRLRPDSTRTQLRAEFRDTTGALVSDLPLQEDDEVQVFSVAQFRPTRYVEIAGDVRRPGQYPYREGMTVRDLALLAGGLQESAYLTEAEVARLPASREGGLTAVKIRVPLDSSYLFERTADGKYGGPPGLPAPAGNAPEVPLSPYDAVLILRQPDWEVQRTAVVSGEVRYPGRYALLTKTERLRDLVERAGGVTKQGYAEGVVFYRSENRLGRIGIDLPRVLRDRKFEDNLILQDRDSIYVPAYNPVVNVQGAVNSPVAVAYVPGADIDFYIRAAGGGSRNADLGRTYVTQPNGKVESVERHWYAPNKGPRPRAGSVIYVPERDPADKINYVQAAGSVAQILASIVALIVVVARR